jgi:dipeptidyl aminopeptidase/acylaminoacyl peptidase
MFGRNRAGVLATLLVVCNALSVWAQEPYKLPPQAVVDLLDAPPLPIAMTSPTRDRVAFIQRAAMATIADLSSPVARLAGSRINTNNFGPYAGARTKAVTITNLADRRELQVQMPSEPNLINISWSPDGKRIAFGQRAANAVELWIADALTGQSRKIANVRLNGTGGQTCSWLADATRLLCRLLPSSVGAVPLPPATPRGPIIQESLGQRAPVRTYEDLLSGAYDEVLYDYYFTSQLAFVDAVNGNVTPVGTPAIFLNIQPSPDNQYLLISRVVKPYSYQVPQQSFPRVNEVWNSKGEVVYKVAAYPLEDDRPSGYVTTLPRSASWRSNEPAALVWVEALDEGNPRKQAEYRDQLMMLRAPFSGAAIELGKTRERFADVDWTEGGYGLVSERIRRRHWSRTYVINPDQPQAAWRLLWDRSYDDDYSNPGNPVTRSGSAKIVQRGDYIYLEGAGASQNGDRPFLDRLNLRTFKTERLWQSDAEHYSTFVALLDDDAKRIITRRESPTESPNYYLTTTRGASSVALTSFPDPAPQLAGVRRQLVTYKRKDGVPLSATLYLPPGYKSGVQLPVVMWAYPRELASADVAGQVRGSANQFTRAGGASHLTFLTQGYAIFDNPTIPIIGGDTANDTYVEQLVAGAQAAVDKVVEMGVGDRNRIGIGGHSYGAFMTANLLAHTDLFQAGIARSGAYNRTLTPFGFQAEERTFWEEPEIYARMSPFNYADKINEPMLMIHGMADDNSGTFPIQSERMYAAIKGHGGTVRFVYLPLEAHGYSARESIMHTVAEMISWFDKYVKKGPRVTS